jgi:hypothetical protein
MTTAKTTRKTKTMGCTSSVPDTPTKPQHPNLAIQMVPTQAVATKLQASPTVNGPFLLDDDEETNLNNPLTNPSFLYQQRQER